LVKNSRRDCCAIANGPFDSEVQCKLTHTLFGRARMPVRVRKMSPAIPLTAALAILLGAVVTRFIHARNCLTELFLGFYACRVHCILHGTKGNAAGKRQSASAFHDANFVHAAAGNIHPSVGGCRHIANCASSRQDSLCRSNPFEQIPSRMHFPCSRAIFGPSLGLNSWDAIGCEQLLYSILNLMESSPRFSGPCGHLLNLLA